MLCRIRFQRNHNCDSTALFSSLQSLMCNWCQNESEREFHTSQKVKRTPNSKHKFFGIDTALVESTTWTEVDGDDLIPVGMVRWLLLPREVFFTLPLRLDIERMGMRSPLASNSSKSSSSSSMQMALVFLNIGRGPRHLPKRLFYFLVRNFWFTSCWTIRDWENNFGKRPSNLLFFL